MNNAEQQSILKVAAWFEAMELPRMLRHFQAGSALCVTFESGLSSEQINQIEALNLKVTRTLFERNFIFEFMPGKDDEE